MTTLFHAQVVKLSGTEFRRRLRAGEAYSGACHNCQYAMTFCLQEIPEWFAFKSVAWTLGSEIYCLPGASSTPRLSPFTFSTFHASPSMSRSDGLSVAEPFRLTSCAKPATAPFARRAVLSDGFKKPSIQTTVCSLACFLSLPLLVPDFQFAPRRPCLSKAERHPCVLLPRCMYLLSGRCQQHLPLHSFLTLCTILFDLCVGLARR